MFICNSKGCPRYLPRKPVERVIGVKFSTTGKGILREIVNNQGTASARILSKKRLAIQENLVYDAIPILKAEVWFMCKEKEITVLKVSPHKKPEVVTLKNELSALQEAVSSGVKDYHHLIQLVGVEEGVDLLLNDEGELIGFEPDRRFGQDVLVGDFYVVGTDGENLASLPQDKMEKYAALSRAGQMRGARQRAQLPLFLPGRVSRRGAEARHRRQD